VLTAAHLLKPRHLLTQVLVVIRLLAMFMLTLSVLDQAIAKMLKFTLFLLSAKTTGFLVKLVQ
jgi:hypothetical protein